MKFFRHPKVAGLLAFLSSEVGLLFLAGPVKCADGWRSASVGIRGACSWHGGVADNGWTVVIAGFIGVGFWGYCLTKLEEHEREERYKREGYPKPGRPGYRE